VVVCCPDEKESPPALAPVEPGVCPNWGAEAEKPPAAFIIDSLVCVFVLLFNKNDNQFERERTEAKGWCTHFSAQESICKRKGGLGGSINHGRLTYVSLDRNLKTLINHDDVKNSLPA